MTNSPDKCIGIQNEATPEGHCAVEAACVHRCLDDRDVSRKEGDQTLSLWGRVMEFVRMENKRSIRQGAN